MGIRVLLADDHKINREGLRLLFGAQPDFEVVGEAQDGVTALRLTRELQPDVVVADVRMPGMGESYVAGRLLAECPKVKVVALSVQCDRSVVEGILKAGASACLPGDCGFEELAQAVRAVAANHSYLNPRIARVVIEDYVRCLSTAQGGEHSTLTAREQKVLRLIVDGMSTKEAASSLQVSVRTVEAHRQQIMNKLNIHRTPELIRHAIQTGLLVDEK